MSLELSLANTTSIDDVEPWMFRIARTRPGMYTIRVRTMSKNRIDGLLFLFGVDSSHEVSVNFTGEEFAKLDKVIMNQTYAESKSKVQSAIVYQHASVIWPSHTPDDVTMRTLGAWAITQYRCNGEWVDCRWKCVPPVILGAAAYRRSRVLAVAAFLSWVSIRLRQTKPATLEYGPERDRRRFNIEPAQAKWIEWKNRFLEWVVRVGGPPLAAPLADGAPPDDPPPPDGAVEVEQNQAEQEAPQEEAAGEAPQEEEPDQPAPEEGVPRNELGFVEPGHGNADLHPMGGNSDEDSQIRALRDDRIVENSAGIGVVGQSREPGNSKQIVGVVSLPVTDNPNVYAREAASIESAIDQRITRKQRPFTANKDDKALIGRLVSEAIGDNPRRSLFSARRVTQWWEKSLFSDLRSGKWTEDRLNKTIEGLCCRIQPSFKLSCDVKLEPMPEGKAPRMLIADGDEGQVLALLTICCIEDLIKKHMPKKTIKGLGKRKAMERIAAELRVPNAAYSKTSKGPAQSTERSGQNGAPGASVFEGDGSAWDTTCSSSLRDCVENPVIIHVATILKVMMSQPESWVQAHSDVSVLRQLTLTFKKNGEFRKFIIDAIRRSGHRGTSALNWWTNFTCWHCAIFEMPEMFLDPDVRYGRDHAGILRWLASAFEGDDSILSTTPKIKEDDELYVSLMQRWERLGFNMKIFIRETRALFTGYYHALDKNGPTGVLMPEIDRCFARAGISCSPTMIECFKAEDRNGCQAISRAAALSRAYEFAGLSPTISTKYLRFYESLTVKTKVDRDLVMRTCGSDAEFAEPEIVAEINLKNGAAMSFDSSERDRLAAVGFECTEEELSQFTLRLWDYEVLKDWDGFRASLPQSWRMAEA